MAVITPTEKLIDRKAISAAIQTLIDFLDIIDGDADLEANGDEQDGEFTEDDFQKRIKGKGPGCCLADPGGAAADDEGEREDEGFCGNYGIDQRDFAAPIWQSNGHTERVSGWEDKPTHYFTR